MKAWEVRGGELGLHDVEKLPPAEDTETMVQVLYSGLCGSDLPKLSRPTDFALPEPWRPGHEVVGLDPEGRVAAVDPLVPCEACPRCDTGDTHLCSDLRRLGWDLPGGFAEYVTVPTTNAYSLPRELDPLHAVLADPAAVAIHGLRCNPVGEPGRLAVIGAGAIGLLTALYACDQGWSVTVVHRQGRPPHRAVTRAVPALFCSASALPERETFETVVDAASGADSAPLDLALRIVRDGGTIVVQNAYHPGVRFPTPPRDVFRRSIRLIGTFSHCRRQQPNDFRIALTFLREHSQRIDHLVTDAGNLSELPSILASSTHVARQAMRVCGLND